MSTYAEWTASHTTSSNDNNGPVKLLVDAISGDVLSMNDIMQIDEASTQAIIAEVRQQRISNSHNNEHHHHHDIVNPIVHWDRHKEIPLGTILLMIDTNWLISHLALFKSIEKLVPQTDNYAPLVFILSSVVLRELDGLKNAHDLNASSNHAPGTAALARQAASTILHLLQTRPDLFRGQRAEEQVYTSTSQTQTNDERILDLCLFFQKKGYQVGLLTDDTILCTLAQSHGVPPLRYEAKDRDPTYFLNKLHPDLVPYFTSLRSSTTAQQPSTSSSTNTTNHNLATLLLPARDLQSRLMPEYNARYPILPPDLLILISRITSTLLSPYIYTTLLSSLANDNLEIFEYMLKRMPIFRKSKSEDEALNSRNWSGEVCVRLLDMNWSCFSDRAGAPPSKEVVESRNSSGTANSLSDSTGQPPTSTSTANSPAQAGVATSKWASSPSSSSNRRSTSGPSSTFPPSSGSSGSFHPSKLSALASSLSYGTASSSSSSLSPEATNSKEQAILKWSPARWSIFLEDLETLLSGTMILQEKEDRERGRTWMRIWKANVECWRR